MTKESEVVECSELESADRMISTWITFLASPNLHMAETIPTSLFTSIEMNI